MVTLKTNDCRLYRDSGDVLFPIGRNDQKSQTSLSPGDELLMHVKAPGTPLGMRYDRAVVLEILFDAPGKKAIGFSGRSGEREAVWKFADLDISDSYIETFPWDGRANSIPGAFNKRVPYQEKKGFRHRLREMFESVLRGEADEAHAEAVFDLFGYRHTHARERVEVEPWEERPLTFSDWLELNRLAMRKELQLDWAYWVLRLPHSADLQEVRKAFQQLSRSFHPELGGDLETMTQISIAYDTLKRHLGH